MTTRNITFTGHAVPNSSMVVNINDQEVFAGPVHPTTTDDLFACDITIKEVDVNNVPDMLTSAAIPYLATFHTVKVECLQGAVTMVDVTTPMLKSDDFHPIVPDPDWFAKTFLPIHRPGYNFAEIKEPLERATLDPKFNVMLNGKPYHIDRGADNYGAWHCTVPESQILQFQILVKNLMTFM